MSSWDDLRLQVTPGEGLVVRSPAALLVVPAFGEHQRHALEQLTSLIRAGRPGGGRVLARKVAGIIAGSEPEDVPDLALLAGLGHDNVAVLVLGEAQVTAQTPQGPVTLSGRESLTWVDKVLSAPSRIVVGMPDDPEPVAVPVVDLVVGAVPGGGALLEPRDAGAAFAPSAGQPVAEAAPITPPPIDTAKKAPASGSVAAPPPSSPVAPETQPEPPAGSAPEPAHAAYVGDATEAMPAEPAESPEPAEFPEPAAEPEPTGGVAEHAGHDHAVPPPRNEDFQVEPLGGFDDEPREPLPVEPEAAAPSADAPQQHHTDLVEGVYCKRGHFTDPDSQFCIVCGIGLYETKIKRKGVRPELGFLVFDDGSVFHLDHDYVLGRQPEVDDEVKTGAVRGLRLDDAGGTVSRAHAIVRLVGWNVTIADRKSQNGTLVAVKGSDQFVPVARDQPITLVPGSRIQLGQRTLVYESQRGRS